jgi:Uncharacterized protein conserved in bacteria (DUF2213)
MESVRFNDLEITRFDTDDAGTMTVTAIARAPGPLVYRNMDGTVRTEVVSSDFLRRLDADEYPLAGRLGGIPVTLEHPPKLLRKDANEIKKYGKGAVKNKGIKVYSDGRTEVQFEVMDSDAQEAIRSGEKPGVSLGYRCNTVHRDGVFYQEEPYEPDHLAITAAPRAKAAMITDFRMDSGTDLAWEVREDGADMSTRRAIFNGEIPGGFAGLGMSYPVYSASSAVGAWMSCQYGDMTDADQMRGRILQIANDNGFMDLMPEEAFIWAEKNGVRLDGCSCEEKSEETPKTSKKKPEKEALTMDSEAGQQLYAYDLEDGQPPIMLDSESWQALRSYADAKGSGPCGKGWVGTRPNCKRGKAVNNKGDVAAFESGALNRVGSENKYSKLGAKNAARLAVLRERNVPFSNLLTRQDPALISRDKGKGAITAANTKRAKDKSAAAKRKATREKNRVAKNNTDPVAAYKAPLDKITAGYNEADFMGKRKKK